MKRALLVGINYVGTDHELHGCINDSNNMKAYLTAHGFTEIKQILEADATTAGIIAGLNWLVSGLSPTDVIAFHYSGHGSQMPRPTNPTVFEEIICPVDLDWMTKIITDDTLSSIFNQVPNGVNTTVILDCCHSGGMLEQAGEFIPTATSAPTTPAASKELSRFLPPPANIAELVKGMQHADWNTSRDINESAVLIAGCGVDQTSADTVLNGQPCGAATAALLQNMSGNSPISYKDLVTSMELFMVAGGYTQTPELDGNPKLYDQAFLEPFTIVIPPPTPDASPITVPSQPVSKSSSSGSSNTLLYVGIVVLLVVLFAFLH